MEIAFVLAAIVLFHICAVCIGLWKANQHLINHQHVMPLIDALPVQGELIQQLIVDMSGCAGIQPPDVFIYRSRLPNAFISAIALRPELFLSDEALEEANESSSPLEVFIQLIGHELAHIKLHHRLYHAPIMYIAQSTSFWFSPFKRTCRRAIDKLESEADMEGARIAKLYIRKY